MEQILSLIVELKERIKSEKVNYIQAIGDGKEGRAKDIMHEIAILEKELEKMLSPYKSDS